MWWIGTTQEVGWECAFASPDARWVKKATSPPKIHFISQSSTHSKKQESRKYLYYLRRSVWSVTVRKLLIIFNSLITRTFRKLTDQTDRHTRSVT